VIAISIFCGSGCSRKSHEQPGEVNLRFMVWGSATERKVWLEMIDSFKKEYPKVSVTMEQVSDWNSYWSKLLTLLAGGNAPDVFWMFPPLITKFVEKDTLLSFDGYFENDKEIDLKDFYPVALDSVKCNNRIWTLPMNVDTIVLYYNKALFDKAGVSYPKQNWTWEDFVKTAKALTKDLNNDTKIDQYGYYMEGPMECANWVYLNGGRFFSENGECTIDSPKCVEAIQFCMDLNFKHNITPSFGNSMSKEMGSEQMFMTGRIAMYPSGYWMVSRFKNIKTFKWDVASYPRKSDGYWTVVNSGPAIYKNTKHPKEAYEFAKYVTGKEGQKKYSELGISVPSRKSVATSESFMNPQSLQDNNVFLRQLQYTRRNPMYWTSDSQRIEDIMNKNLEKAWIDTIPAKEITKKIKDEINKFVQKK
jgi:multiple sugar transport system substrate-binding protein